MARQSKHIRFQVAHKAAQMMAEEGISDYAFAKHKAAKFFGLDDGDALPSNNEINDAIKEHQAIYFDEEHVAHLKALRLEALSVMKKLNVYNPYLTGAVLDGTAGFQSVICIELYVSCLKEIEIFFINLSLPFKIDKQKNLIRNINGNKCPATIFKIQGQFALIEILISEIEEFRIKKHKGSIKEVESLLNILK
jgi:hypothetical protein